MSKKKSNAEEFLMQIDENDVVVFEPNEEFEHYAMRVFGTILSGRLEGEKLRFYSKWGSEGEQRRFRSAAIALGADPEAELPVDTAGLGSVRTVTAVVRPNNRTGDPEIWFFKPADEESEYY